MEKECSSPPGRGNLEPPAVPHPFGAQRRLGRSAFSPQDIILFFRTRGASTPCCAARTPWGSERPSAAGSLGRASGGMPGRDMRAEIYSYASQC